MVKMKTFGYNLVGNLAYLRYALIPLSALTVIAVVIAIVAYAIPWSPSIQIYKYVSRLSTYPEPSKWQTCNGVHPQSWSFADMSDKTWIIVAGKDWGGHEYYDWDSGRMSGFNKDLVTLVCLAAGIKCRLVWGSYKECWLTTQGGGAQGGEGLMKGRYDACTGYIPTKKRAQVFDFSLPLFIQEPAYFIVRQPVKFNFSDIANTKIGFMEGWAYGEHCVNVHTGVKLRKEQVFYFETPTEVLKALRDGKIDAIFSSAEVYPSSDTPNTEIVVLRERSYLCDTSDKDPTGHSMMTRKDSTFNKYWNEGFRQIISDGRLKKLCDSALCSHGKRGRLLQCDFMGPNHKRKSCG